MQPQPHHNNILPSNCAIIPCNSCSPVRHAHLPSISPQVLMDWLCNKSVIGHGSDHCKKFWNIWKGMLRSQSHKKQLDASKCHMQSIKQSKSQPNQLGYLDGSNMSPIIKKVQKTFALHKEGRAKSKGDIHEQASIHLRDLAADLWNQITLSQKCPHVLNDSNIPRSSDMLQKRTLKQ